MSDERAAFALVLSGFVLQILAAVFMWTFGVAWPFGFGVGMMGMMGYYYRGTAYPYVYPWVSFWLGFGVVALALGATSVYLLGKDKPDVTLGSVLALLGAVLAFPLMWGFMVGSLLMFVGAIVGLVGHQ